MLSEINPFVTPSAHIRPARIESRRFATLLRNAYIRLSIYLKRPFDRARIL